MTGNEIADFGKSLQETAERLLRMTPVWPAGSAVPPMPEMVEVDEGVWLSREIVNLLSEGDER